MSHEHFENRPDRSLVWLAPGLSASGYRRDAPRLNELIHEATGRVLRWTGVEWVDDLPGWLLLQYSRDRNQNRDQSDIDRIEQARWEAWELGKRLHNARPGSDAANDAELKLRMMAAPFAGRGGWHESWAVRPGS